MRLSGWHRPGTYLIRRILALAISLFFVATLTFTLMHAIPGDPFMQEEAIPEEVLASLYRYYGLDRPLWEQYFKYLKGLIIGDLGPSLRYAGRTVNQIIARGFPVSAILGIEALLFAISAGISLGAISAWKRRKWQDHAASIAAVLGISVPSFTTAALLQYVFAVRWGLFPVARWDGIEYSVLPALSIAALPTAFIARLTRASMIEVLHQDHVLTARAKGLSPKYVLFRHVLRNALLPVVTYLGPLSASVLTGSFVVERVYAIPGLGHWFIASVTNRDYTVILGVAIFYSTLLIVAVFLVDLLYTWIDPRIRCHCQEPQP